MASQDRLEEYVRRVCRSLGGPRAMRDHVRQELREHLLDAAAEHRAAGLGEAEAVERAIREFGEPETVRDELEAAHGHRVMAVVIDQALAWKEKTMRAKWLWTTWAHLAVVAIVVLEILFCTFSVIYILPKMKKLRLDGLLVSGDLAGPQVNWMYDFLFGWLPGFLEHINWLVLLIVVGLWGLFEWRFRGENKAYIRLSVLGTLGAGLMVLVFLLAASMVLPFTLSMPGLVRPEVPPWVTRNVVGIEEEMGRVKEAAAKQDWAGAAKHAEETERRLHVLGEGQSLALLAHPKGAVPREELEAAWKASQAELVTVQTAIAGKEAQRLDEAMKKFRDAYGPIRGAAGR